MRNRIDEARDAALYFLFESDDCDRISPVQLGLELMWFPELHAAMGQVLEWFLEAMEESDRKGNNLVMGIPSIHLLENKVSIFKSASPFFKENWAAKWAAEEDLRAGEEFGDGPLTSLVGWLRITPSFTFRGYLSLFIVF